MVIGGDNLPSPVAIGLTDLPNIGGASGPPGPSGSGITALQIYSCLWHMSLTNNVIRYFLKKQILTSSQDLNNEFSHIQTRLKFLNNDKMECKKTKVSSDLLTFFNLIHLTLNIIGLIFL